jgi:hypothetical protein
MIKDEEDADDSEDEGQGDPEDNAEVLRYQGTFEGIEGSGLHVAIRYGREDVAWLLLALASSLDWSKFPPPVLQAMARYSLTPKDRKAGVDIRTIKDSDGKTARSLAEELGGVWKTWISAGRLESSR